MKDAFLEYALGYAIFGEAREILKNLSGTIQCLVFGMN